MSRDRHERAHRRRERYGQRQRVVGRRGPLPAEGFLATLDVDEDKRVCRSCGCTTERACEGGCWWVTDDLCSHCMPDLGPGV